MVDMEMIRDAQDFSGEVALVVKHRVEMVSLKADLTAPATRAAIEGALGAGLPGQRQITTGADGLRVAWMAADEMLIMVPEELGAGALITRLESAVSAPMLAVDVSDARKMIVINGKMAREVLAKGAPVDLSPRAFGPGDFRRTRLGQVAVAFWMSGEEEFSLLCFTSYWRFVFDWLSNAARKGTMPAVSQKGIFAPEG